MKPRVENAPGIVWRQVTEGWEARWQARTDLVAKGFTPKSQRLWIGSLLTDAESAYISDTCRRLQDEMLVFGRGDVPKITDFHGDLKSLIVCYQTDPSSTYHKLRFAVRKNHDQVLKRITLRHGHEEVADIKAKTLIIWHQEWTDGDKKIAMGHAFIGQLRTLFGFGAFMLEDEQCERLCAVLHKMRFKAPKPRTERLTADQAVAHRVQAHRRGWDSMALAQAIQFEGTLRQKDVIGEWVPVSEPGISDVIKGTDKWIVGLRWEEVDEHLILRHNTSKRGKDIEVDFRLAPMVMEELALYSRTPVAKLTRDALPPSGPIIICEINGYPYTTAEFRRKWRKVANMAGIPKAVRSMDSRAGAISEAVSAGAPLTLVRHAATHSDIGMTQKYDREAAAATATVMKIRVADRNKPKT